MIIEHTLEERKMHRHLQNMFREIATKFFLPSGKGWFSYLGKMGIRSVTHHNLLGDCDRFQGHIVLEDPADTRSFLLIPKDFAVKIKVLGGLPTPESVSNEE